MRELKRDSKSDEPIQSGPSYIGFEFIEIFIEEESDYQYLPKIMLVEELDPNSFDYDGIQVEFSTKTKCGQNIEHFVVKGDPMTRFFS